MNVSAYRDLLSMNWRYIVSIYQIEAYTTYDAIDYLTDEEVLSWMDDIVNGRSSLSYSWVNEQVAPVYSTNKQNPERGFSLPVNIYICPSYRYTSNRHRNHV